MVNMEKRCKKIGVIGDKQFFVCDKQSGVAVMTLKEIKLLKILVDKIKNNIEIREEDISERIAYIEDREGYIICSKSYINNWSNEAIKEDFFEFVKESIADGEISYTVFDEL